MSWRRGVRVRCMVDFCFRGVVLTHSFFVLLFFSLFAKDHWRLNVRLGVLRFPRNLIMGLYWSMRVALMLAERVGWGG